MELHWWLKEIPKACTNIHLPKVDFVIHTNASQTGWGATDRNNPTGGKWLENQEDHINYLELKAIFLAVRDYQRYWRWSRHIQMKSDNTIAIAYVNNMGGIVSEKCNYLSKQIWDLYISENIWISAVHIPGKQNTIVDFMSRSLNENTE